MITGSPQPKEIYAPTRGAVAPSKKVDEAFSRLRCLTPDEVRRVNAHLRYGTFQKAAGALGCDPDTVSAAWHRYRKLLADVVDGILQESPDPCLHPV